MALSHPFADNPHGVYVGGPIGKTEGKAEGTVTPGAILIAGTADGEVKEATAGAKNAVGVALDNDWNDTNEDYLADFADNEFIPVGTHPGLRFMGILAASQSIAKGDLLQTAANGELQAMPGTLAAGDSMKAVARYVGEADVSTGAGVTKRIQVEYLG